MSAQSSTERNRPGSATVDALHGPGRRPLPEPEQREREADALGIYYYERAGYDCRDWAASATARDRDALRAACDLARRGARVR